MFDPFTIALAPITTNPDLLVGIVAAMVGGVGVKIFDYFNNKSEIEVDDATRLREELRAQVRALQEQFDRVNSELEEYREKEFELAFVREELMLKNQALQVEVELLRSKMELGD